LHFVEEPVEILDREVKKLRQITLSNPYSDAFETDETAPTPRPPQIRIPFAQTRLRRARKSVRPEPPMSASMEARIDEHAAALTPPLPVVSSPLPLPSPLTTSPTDTGAPLGYRVAGIRMRAAV
ncbi:hypothetical protein Tco_0402264, partial [Tanacetum coccineum]